MGGRLSSLTRCIRNAVATWCEFCPEIRKKTIAFWWDFFTAKFERKQKKQEGIQCCLCNFYPPYRNEDQNKKVLLDDCIV